MFKTHLAFSFLLALSLFKYFNLNFYLFLIIFILAGILPDIDHSKSWIGRKFKLLSWLINFIFGHRKLIHSIFFAVFLAIIVKIFFNDYYIPFFLGYLSHLFLDSLTKQGVRILYPLKFKTSWIIRTNSIVEKLLLIILIILIVYKLIYIF